MSEKTREEFMAEIVECAHGIRGPRWQMLEHSGSGPDEGSEDTLLVVQSPENG